LGGLLKIPGRFFLLDTVLTVFLIKKNPSFLFDLFPGAGLPCHKVPVERGI